MPQLEQIEFFISQLFWLGVFFGILIVVLTYFTLPKIRAFLNKRDEFVNSHLSKQDELIAASLEYSIIGLPRNDLIFFRGILLLPPLAVIMAIEFI